MPLFIDDMVLSIENPKDSIKKKKKKKERKLETKTYLVYSSYLVPDRYRYIL